MCDEHLNFLVQPINNTSKWYWNENQFLTLTISTFYFFLKKLSILILYVFNDATYGLGILKHSVEITKIYSHWKNISWNHVTLCSTCQKVDFTKIMHLWKWREYVQFTEFPHCVRGPQYSIIFHQKPIYYQSIITHLLRYLFKMYKQQ